MENVFKNILWFILLCAAQIFVFNHIHLFHYATPLMYIYFIMRFPLTSSRCGLLMWSFCLGLIIDIFANTPGVATASLTIVGFVQPYIIQLFLPKDDFAPLQPSISVFGFGVFLKYASTIVLLFTLLFFSFEAFNLFNFQDWILRVVASAAITVLFIVVLESLKK